MNTRTFFLRETLEKLYEVAAYFRQQRASGDSVKVYEDALCRCIDVKNPLPQWYWLQDGDSIVGRAGLITNDFINRGELWPWLCALYADPRYHGHGLVLRLTEHIAQQAKQLGFMQLHLCTDLEGLYEKAGLYFDEPDYHPRGKVPQVYSRNS